MKKGKTAFRKGILACLCIALSACGRAVSMDSAAKDGKEETAAVTEVKDSQDRERQLYDAMKQAAEQMIHDAVNVKLSLPEYDGTPSKNLPDSFDLRAADRNNDGITENYVTSVKQQRPFGDCWAFSALAAAETSILYELGWEAVITDADDTEITAAYINTEDNHWAHYCYQPVQPTHGVVIVGWDDSYSKETFLSSVIVKDQEGKVIVQEDGTPKTKAVPQPPGDGAWIVKNSWGAKDSIGQGNNLGPFGVDGSGYFYLSYYDQSLLYGQCFDFDTENTADSNSVRSGILAHDYMFGELPRSVFTTFPIMTANVFTAEADEEISALSCVTANAEETVEFSIYVLDEDGFVPREDSRMCTVKETIPFAGVHVIDLETPVSLNKGQRFAVVLNQKSKEASCFSIGADFSQKGYEAGYCWDSYAAAGVVNPGESYLWMEGQEGWMDFSEVKKALEAMEGPTSYISYDNFPIRAYVRPRT